MSYQVTKSLTNGYRCGCCASDFDLEPRWYDDRDKALAEVPRTLKEAQGNTSLLGEGGLREVVVIDGSTGQVIAEGKQDWPTGGVRGSGYGYTRWSGYTPEDSFEIIIGRDEKPITDRTWSQILDAVRRERHEQEVKKAGFELEEAQKKLKQLKHSP
jgi:hypothetical protein